MVTEIQMLHKRKDLDIVSASEMNCNRTVSMQQAASLIGPATLYYNVNIIKNIKVWQLWTSV